MTGQEHHQPIQDLMGSVINSFMFGSSFVPPLLGEVLILLMCSQCGLFCREAAVDARTRCCILLIITPFYFTQIIN